MLLFCLRGRQGMVSSFFDPFPEKNAPLKRGDVVSEKKTESIQKLYRVRKKTDGACNAVFLLKAPDMRTAKSCGGRIIFTDGNFQHIRSSSFCTDIVTFFRKLYNYSIRIIPKNRPKIKSMLRVKERAFTMKLQNRKDGTE